MQDLTVHADGSYPNAHDAGRVRHLRYGLRREVRVRDEFFLEELADLRFDAARVKVAQLVLEVELEESALGRRPVDFLAEQNHHSLHGHLDWQRRVTVAAQLRDGALLEAPNGLTCSLQRRLRLLQLFLFDDHLDVAAAHVVRVHLGGEELARFLVSLDRRVARCLTSQVLSDLISAHI